MSKVRINDLARELEVKSKSILDALPLVGVREKKTHSSPVEEEEAQRLRAHFRSRDSARVTITENWDQDTTTKINLARISKPGDVPKAIISKQAISSAKSEAATPAVPSRATLATHLSDAKPTAPAPFTSRAE